jgi:hypothetical protein
MKKHLCPTYGSLAAGMIMAAACVGCTLSRFGGDITPYTPEEMERLRAQARDPRVFFMNAYPEESGAVVFTDTNRLRNEMTVTLPFVSPGNTAIPLLTLRSGDDMPITALTDTSSVWSWVPLHRRRALGLELLGPELYLRDPEHVPDNVPGVAAVLPQLRFGDLSMEMALVYGRAAHGGLWPLSRDPRTAQADLVIGMNILRAFAWVQWDFPNRRVIVSSAGPYEGGENARLADLPLQGVQGPLTVVGEIEGQATPLTLDVAGDYEMAMENPPADIIRQVALGDMVFRRLEVRSPRAAGVSGGSARLGRRALAPFCLTLDNRRKRLYIERPATEPPPAAAMDEDGFDVFVE